MSSAYSPGDIRVYPLSKLQLVRPLEEGGEGEGRGSVHTAQGLVQTQPICLLESEDRRVTSDVVTGFR